MFGVSDLITVLVINDGLAHLRAHPDHLQFILSQFCQNEKVRELVGVDHIQQCMDFVLNNKIAVMPYYQIDRKHRPMVSVVFSTEESQQYLGDYGNEQLRDVVIEPTVYAQFNAKAASKDTISVSRDLKLENRLWVGMAISNGIESAVIKGILVKKSQDTVLYLDRELSEHPRLVGWKAQSSEKTKGYLVSASTDSVNIQCNLVTTGDYSVHRLLCMVIRYCLKKGRLLFDSYGLQTPTFSQSMPVASEDTELEFESVFTIHAKFTDHWVEKDFETPDRAANLVVAVTADSDDPRKEEVELD